MGKTDNPFHDDDHGFPVDPLLHIIDVLADKGRQVFFAFVNIVAVSVFDQVIVVRRVVHSGLVGNAVGEDQRVYHILHVVVFQLCGKVSEGVPMPLLDNLSELLFFFFAPEVEVVGDPLIQRFKIVI